jgi:hypothetical protein
MSCLVLRIRGPFVCLAAFVFLAAGCGAAQRDESGTITASGDVGVEQLVAGDCVNAPEGVATNLNDLDGVPCATAHDGEVFLTEALPEGDYPGTASVMASAEAVCMASADAYLGVPLGETALEVYFLYPPGADEWAADRTIVCVLHHPGESITGTLKGNGSEHPFSAAGWKVGQCFGAEDMTPIPCADEHLVEVFVVGTLPDGDLSISMVSDLMGVCEKAFPGYVGRRYAGSSLDFFPVAPTEAGWAGGDRSYACVLMDVDEDLLIGTAKGSKL